MQHDCEKPEKACMRAWGLSRQGILWTIEKAVVTPLRGDRNPRGQEFLERPEMIRQPQGHCWRPLVVAMYTVLQRQPQSSMRPMEVVIKELQAHECIPGVIPFGERMGLASEGIEPIAQRPVEPFHMHGPGWLHMRPQCGADLH